MILPRKSRIYRLTLFEIQLSLEFTYYPLTEQYVRSCDDCVNHMYTHSSSGSAYVRIFYWLTVDLKRTNTYWVYITSSGPKFRVNWYSDPIVNNCSHKSVLYTLLTSAFWYGTMLQGLLLPTLELKNYKLLFRLSNTMVITLLSNKAEGGYK